MKKSKQKIKITLTNIHVAFSPFHITDDAMNAISLEYTDLSSAALIKIFQLADLLSVPPKKAAEIYIATKAEKARKQQAA